MRATDMTADETIEMEKRTGFSINELETLERFDAVEIGRTFISIRGELDEARAIKSRLEKKYDTLKKRLAQKMEDEGLEKFSVDGKNITTRVEVFASIPKDHREDAYNWLKDNGYGEIIIDTVNAQTLKSLVKEQLSEGKSFPEDLIKIYTELQARFY